MAGNPDHCLPPGQESLIVSDVAAQDARLLLAVHQPPVLRRMPVPLPGQGRGGPVETVGQDELLELLVDGKSPEGTLLVPVIGAPGTGKSHLIRWLAAALPVREDLVIRHVPRERTSLPKVIEILFDGLEGPAFDELREALDKARGEQGGLTGVDRLDQVATRLVFRIAEVLQYGLGVPWRHAADVPSDIREALCSPDVLPALLTDAVVRESLTREGGVVHRLARDIVEGYDRPENDDETEDLGFRPEDLSLKMGRGIGPVAARALMSLSLPGKREAAAKILSDALDVAAGDVVGLGSVSLADLFEQFRSKLLEEGKELLLLFEDIAIARGLQLDLVDALTVPAYRDGVQRLCTLRVALAVTSDYWDTQAPETLSTRAHAWGARMFDLSLPEPESKAQIPELVGRYLNAARLTTQRIHTMSSTDLAPVPNACESCDLRPDCHAVFGASDEGHGLYPLTRRAALRLGRIADKQLRPRLILSDVVAPILTEHDVLADGRFPSERFQATVSGAVESHELDEISLDEIAAVEKLPAADRDRARALLRAWLDGTDRGANGQVLATFGLPASLSEVHPGQGEDGGDEKGGEPDHDPGEGSDGGSPEPQRSRHIAQLEAWAGGEVSLGPTLSRTLRATIWSELRDGIRWNEFGLNRNAVLAAVGIGGGSAAQLQNRTVQIAKQSGGGALQRAADPLVRIEANAENSRLLIAFWRRGEAGNFAFDGGLEAMARIRSFVAEAEDGLRERLRRTMTPNVVADTARLLVLASAPLAWEIGFSDPPGFLAALSHPDHDGHTAGPRSQEWNAFKAAATQAHDVSLERLRGAVTRSQGEGAAPTAIDYAAIAEVVDGRDPAGLARKLKTRDVAEQHAALKEAAIAGVEGEARSVGALLHRIDESLGSATRLDLDAIGGRVQDAISVAMGAGVLAPGDALRRVQDIDLPPKEEAAELFERARTAVRVAGREFSLEAVVRLARLEISTLERVADYLDSAASLLEDSVQLARRTVGQRARPDGGVSRAEGEIREALQRIERYCEELA